MSDKAEPDRRVRRTQSALLTAFSRLAMEQHLDRIKVADIIREADVGRSTFYDHFSSRDALLLKAMERPLAALAGVVERPDDPAALVPLMQHFWEQRALARQSFNGPLRPQIARLLASLILPAIDRPEREAALLSIQLAEGQIGLVRAWANGEVSAQPAELAEAICAAARAVLQPGPGVALN